MALSRPYAKLRLISLPFVLLLSAVSPAQQPNVAQSRITQRVDDSDRVSLHDPIHNLARAEFDRGTAETTQPMNRIMLLLQRSDEQERALRQMIDEQQMKTSKNYRRWLTPKEFGLRFGPSDADIETITSWLTQHGFNVKRVSAGRTVVEFSGNAGQIREAFRTQIHKYSVEGREYLGNSSEPSVPAALAPLVAGFVSLNNFPSATAAGRSNRFGQQYTKASPSYTTSGTIIYAVAPYDFATIYDSIPLWQSTPSIDGAGQSIALVERSDICTSGSPDFGTGKLCGTRDDIQNFRSYFGLPSTLPGGQPPVVVVVNGPNPGITEPSSGDSAAPDDEREAILDAEVAGGVARNAQVQLVVSQSTEATGGDILSAEYIIDNNLAPVMSVSFLSCEANVGSTFNILWEQAAAQGITVTVSSGDSGAAGCDAKTANAASKGLAVNGIASTPFNVAVGGTDFADAGNQKTYWSSSDSPGTNESALSYIPEIPWNNSCATNGLAGCSSVSPTSSSLTVLAGGGGSSKCPSGVPGSFCSKPPWQSGPVVGVPQSVDGTRDLPDVVLFSSSGSASESAYVICISDANSGDHPCPPFVFDGGTSASAPAFAGVMALVNQYMTGLGEVGRQGNANYVLYALANRQVSTGTQCASASARPSNTCVFYDLTQGNNSVPCVGGSPDCSSTAVGTFGVLVDSRGNLAWSAGPGYDLASGLGSVNISNLVLNWPAVAGTFAPTTTSLQVCSEGSANCISGGSSGTLTVVHGTPVKLSIGVTPVNVGAGPPSGDAVLIGEPNTLLNNGGSMTSSASYFSTGSPTFVTIAGGVGTGQSTTLIGGDYQLHAHYAGDGTFAASDSSSVNISVLPEASQMSLILYSVTGSSAPSSLASGSSVPYGTPVLVQIAVSSAGSASNTTGTGATGIATVTDNGANLLGGTFPLNSGGFADVEAGIGSSPVLAVGSHNFHATYNGDSNYQSTSTISTNVLTVTPATTSISLAPASTTVVSGSTVLLTATVSTTSVGAAPSTGTIKFMANSTAITGTPQYKQKAGIQPEVSQPGTILASLTGSLTYQPTETSNVTASFSGDSDYTSSSATVTAITVVPYLISSPNTSTSSQVLIAAPGQTGVSPITVQLGNTISSVALYCSISPTPANTATSCAFSPGNTLNGNETVQLELKTTAPANASQASLARFGASGPGFRVLTTLVVLACLATVCLPRRQFRLAIWVGLFCAFCLGSCGKKNSDSVTPGTVPGTYVVTVFGSPNTAQSIAVYFNVQ